MSEIENRAQIKLIDHMLTALCTCELTDKGREFLIKLKDKLKKEIDDAGNIKN